MGGRGGDSIVVGGAPWTWRRTVKTGPRTFTMTGQVRPVRPGQLVTVFAMTARGPVRVGRSFEDGSGVWAASHQFTAPGTFPLVAATTGDLTNYEGRSPDGSLTIR